MVQALVGVVTSGVLVPLGTLVSGIVLGVGGLYIALRGRRVEDKRLELDEQTVVIERARAVDQRIKDFTDRLAADYDRLHAENQQDRATIKVQGDHIAQVELALMSVRAELSAKTAQADSQQVEIVRLQTELAKANEQIARLEAQADVWRSLIAELSRAPRPVVG